MWKRLVWGMAGVAGMFLWTLQAAANRNFVPDWSFQGSSLGQFRTLGDADWRAENGEIIGVPRSPAEAGSFLAVLFRTRSSRPTFVVPAAVRQA